MGQRGPLVVTSSLAVRDRQKNNSNPEGITVTLGPLSGYEQSSSSCWTEVIGQSGPLVVTSSLAVRVRQK